MEQRLFNTFGKRVRILRQDLGYRQTDIVAQMRQRGVEIGQSYLSVLESSDRLPSGEVVAALAEVLGTTTDYLLMLTDDPNPPASREDEPLTLREEQAAYIVDELSGIYWSLSEDDRDTLLRIARALRDANEPRVIE